MLQMNKQRQNPGGIFAPLVVTLAAIIFFAGSARAAILFQNDDFATVESSGVIINSDNEATGDIIMQFGSSLAKTLKYSSTNSRFEFNDKVDMTNHEITSFRVENVVLPALMGSPGPAAIGKIVQLTGSGSDGSSPGCTGPSCPPGTYSWNGAAWKALQGSVTASNASKIVTVGPIGRDYTTIEGPTGAAAYLNTLSGGEMWVDPGTYPITTVVDLKNIRVRGADTSLTVISITGGGKLLVKDTKFDNSTIIVDSGITAGMGLDVQYVASSNSTISFEHMSFTVGTGKVLIDSSSATKPVTLTTLQNCTQSLGGGNIVVAVATSKLAATSKFTIINLLSTSPLKMVDWPTTIIGGSNVVSSGTITTVPDRTIYVSPGMNIQTAITSLGANGGVVRLAVGIHDVTNEITISQNNIALVGEGPGTIVRAQSATWPPASITTDNAVIQVGPANGTVPCTNVVISNFKLQVGPNIHGISINGGSENKVMDTVVQSIGAKNTPGPRVGIVFTDSTTAAGRRLTAARNIINSDTSANRWVDGIHIDGGTEAILGGQLFGYGNNIYDSIIYENIVSEAKETSYAFTNVYASSIFSNRARDLGWNVGGIGLFINNSRDIVVINNTMDGNHNTGTSGIMLFSDVANAIIASNTIRGTTGTCPTDCPINIGIDISGSYGGNIGNIITDNQISTVNTVLQDNGTASKLESNYHRGTVNPTANDDIGDGYGVGTIWVNTASGAAYISVNSTTGAAVWNSLGGGGLGTTANTFTLDSDNTGGNVNLVFGTTNNKILRWDNTAGEFTTVNAGTNLGTYLKINGGTAITGHLSATQASLNSGNIGSASCGNYGTITVTGAAVGDSVTATPTPIAGGIETVNLSWNASVTATNTVTIRACNSSGSNINTANTQTWGADVWKH